MTVVIILIVVAVAAAGAYFAFARRPQLPPAPEHKALPEKTEKKKEEPADRREEAKPAEKKAAPARAEEEEIEAPIEEEAPVQPSAPPRAKRDVSALRKGLAASRGGFIAKLRALVSGKKEIDPAILEQMEEVMLSSDVGVQTTHAILGRLRERLEKHELSDENAVWEALRTEATEILKVGHHGAIKNAGKPTVILMVGVNGVGKTTTIGKLATRARDEGKSVLLGAGDTFRAAAVQQLEVWGKRVSADVVKGKEGSDPGAVAYEATSKAKEAGVDLLFVDTAGRLHTKTPLMDEIKKVRKTIDKALNGAPHETLLVLDATTGQNALAQATQFKEAVDLTGIVLTKLDGTAKGGIVLGVCDALKVPVRYIGLGERAEDLRVFDAEDFVEALFGREDEAVAAE
ncbi:MAG TPA: signal recognition particle-docking protein FtsY [Polyangiaceae bacterium]|jgi:fused signal recognition particle receptor